MQGHATQIFYKVETLLNNAFIKLGATELFSERAKRLWYKKIKFSTKPKFSYQPSNETLNCIFQIQAMRKYYMPSN